jgi:hypothetical protein
LWAEVPEGGQKMQIQLEMGPGFRQTLIELSVMGNGIIAACSKGIEHGVTLMAHHIGSQYLSGQALKVRKGDLRRAVQGWMAGELDGVVGAKSDSAVSKYAWLLGDEEKTIVPHKGKFLTIPVGEALTSTGAIKDEYSHGLRAITKGFFINSKGRLLFGYKVGKKGKFRVLFVLVKSVFIQGTGALYDGAMEKVDAVTEGIQSEIDKVVSD